MKKWHIEGFDRERGTPANGDFVADSETDAVKAASAKGIVVAKVSEIPATDQQTTAKPIGFWEMLDGVADATYNYVTVPVPDTQAAPDKLSFVLACAWLFAALLIVAGIIDMVYSMGPGSKGYDRFHQDNAVGASANALEYLTGSLLPTAIGFLSFGCGVLLMIYIKVSRILKSRS